MLQTLKRFKEKITPGAAVSVSLHVLLLAVLVFGLPEITMDEPDPPEVIEVQLVLPGEETQEEQEQNAEPLAQEESEELETAAAGEPVEEMLRILRPVYEFGEEDTGAEEAADGNAPENEEAEASEEPLAEPEEPEEPGESLEASDAEPTAEEETAEDEEEPAETTETARPSPKGDSEVATTAIAGRPRGVRAGELCATELRRQLLGTVPPHRPNLIPAYRLDEGTVLQARRGAFRTVTGWHNLKFRCEIDEGATRIVSFEFEVGAPIPPAEWAGRGLPAS
ncbi:DUF930 domain-containing protein [Hoeflea sp.]|uniref:DUF930 domain-containing protein n=1 Tax=Hoeflea sp. TaxID=1940281 RepID=UPI003B01B0DF